MVFGKKISTDVVNFLFYLPGKAVRRGYPRGERDNVKGGNGVIALRPVKKRTTTDRRKGEKKKTKLSAQPVPYDLSRKNATPETPETRSPRSFTDNIRANIRFNRIKRDSPPSKFDSKTKPPLPPFPKIRFNRPAIISRLKRTRRRRRRRRGRGERTILRANNA